MRRLLPFAAIIIALLALPALLVPASADQIGAALGLGETVAGAPTAVRPFPVLGGMGVTWAAPDGDPPTGYQVERKRPSGNWASESGTLGSTTTRWVDRNLQPDATAEYRVVALYSDQELASDPVTAHRVAEDPAIGDTDILMIDADRGGAPTWLNDEIAAGVTDSPAQSGSRSLSAGAIEVTMPAALAGPGSYAVGPQDADLRITQAGSSCQLTGTFSVVELAYTADLQVATMAARFSGGSCNGASSVFGEIRVKSTRPYTALRISDPVVDFGRVRSGTEPDTREVTIENVGTTLLGVGSPVLEANDPDWDVTDLCSALVPGATCKVWITYRPSYPADDQVRVRLYDDTGRVGHHLTLRGEAVAPPSTPLQVRARATFDGIDLSWVTPFAGNSPITGYVVRQTRDGSVATYQVPPDQNHWTGQGSDNRATYTVAAVNDVGEGTESTPTSPESRWEQVTVFSGPEDQAATLGGIALPQGSQVVPMGSEPPSGDQADVAASSDGSRVAYAVADGSARSLSVRTEVGNGGYSTTKLLTAPAIRNLAWSPDGTRIAFTTTDGSSPCVDIIAVATHTVERVGCKFDYAAWHPDNRSLMVRDGRVTGARLARVEARAGGATLSALSGTAGVTQTSVSSNGSWLAFVMPGTRIALLPIGGGTPRIVAADIKPVALAWSPNGADLAVLSKGPDHDRIHRLRDVVGSYDHPWWDVVYATQNGEQISDFTWQGRGVTIAPTPAVSGRSVSISFDASAVPSLTHFCALDTGQSVLCTSPFTATGVSSGQHTLRVTARIYPNGYGTVASRSFTVDGTGPVARVTAPAYEASTTATATVRYAATDSSGVKSYDVRYRKATYNGAFGPYSQPWTGTTATSVSLGLAAGYEYCVSVRARDTFGNLGAWSAERCFARPMDDRALTMASAGWTRGSWSAFYLNTATYTGKYGISLTRTVQGKRFYLVATRCNTCGLVSVYLGGKYIGAVNLWASTTQRQVVIGLPAQSSLFTGTLKITTRSTGKLVQIDGLGVRRT